MLSSTSFAIGLLALVPLATASPLQARQDDVMCYLQDENVPAIPEYVDACIEMLRNDFGDQHCSFAIGGSEGPVFCAIEDATIMGIVSTDDRGSVTPTCSQIADAAQAIKDTCSELMGTASVQGDWGTARISVSG